MNIGERIEKIRGGVAREKFTPSLGISRNTLISYEKGTSAPTSDFLNKLLELYSDINPTWLLTGEGPMRRGETPSEAPSIDVGDKRIERKKKTEKPWSEGDWEGADINIQQLLNMTAEVLVSDTVYRPALAANIKSFRRAIDLEKDNRELRGRIETLESRLSALEQRISQTQQKAVDEVATIKKAM